MRKYFLDNIRWTVVILVLLFHTFYYYVAYFNGGGIGGFKAYQPQDGICYVLYPWLMLLLFLVSGISSHYALQKKSVGHFFRARTIKLLIPGTVGLFVWQWTAGYFNLMTIKATAQVGAFEQAVDFLWTMPLAVRYIVMALTGCGHLWYVQLLWFFSILHFFLPREIPEWQLVKVNGHLTKGSKWFAIAICITPFLLLWVAEQTVFPSGRLGGCEIALNLYRPVVYLFMYLMGFYVFSNESVQQLMDDLRWVTIPLSLIGAVLISVFTFGQDAYSPEYLRSWYNNLYAWIVIMAVMGSYHHWLNHQIQIPYSKHKESFNLTRYMSRVSYGWYILHYLFIVGTGYVLKTHLDLPIWEHYAISFAVTFTLTPILYAILSRIPVLRTCVLGEV